LLVRTLILKERYLKFLSYLLVSQGSQGISHERLLIRVLEFHQGACFGGEVLVVIVLGLSGIMFILHQLQVGQGSTKKYQLTGLTLEYFDGLI
jgi:hypothetical protein